MSREINENPELFDKAIKYLRWSYEHAAPSHMTGSQRSRHHHGFVCSQHPRPKTRRKWKTSKNG
ncbi:hypothetical protein NIB75_05165 [Bacteroides uniformis]|nr:hypothetical protein [Bacteroides uniformis]